MGAREARHRRHRAVSGRKVLCSSPEDPHLNNTALSKWDAAAGFSASTGWNAHQQAYRCQLVGGGLWNLYLQHGITSASCAEGVCILKEATRRLIEQEEA